MMPTDVFPEGATVTGSRLRRHPGGATVTNIVNPKKDPERRTPGRRLIWASVALLAGLGAVCFAVSYNAQFWFVYQTKHLAAAANAEALIPDVGMALCAALALGMAVAGRPAKTARILVLAFAGLSAWMNYLAVPVVTVHSVTVYIMPPVAFAVCTDLVVSVVRRFYYGVEETSPWAVLGRTLARAARLAGVIVLYTLRWMLATSETWAGLRQMVLDAAPLPEIPAPGADGQTKKARLLAAYRQHPGYGDRKVVSKVAAELAPAAGLQPGTARSYLYAHLDGQAAP